MKIMALGDAHGSTIYMMRAIELARKEQCDIVFVVGDFGFWEHTYEGVAFLDEVNDLANEHDVDVYFCDGNHECFDLLYQYPIDEDGFRTIRKHIRHAPRGHIWIWNGLSFLAMGGAHSIDGPGGVWTQARGITPYGKNLGKWWPQETIKEAEVKQAIKNIESFEAQGGNIDVIFSHDAPEGVQIPGIEGYPLGNINRHLLAQVVRAAQPQLLVCGHYHLRHSSGLLMSDTRVEILASNGQLDGQFLFIDTEDFKVILPEEQKA